MPSSRSCPSHRLSQHPVACRGRMADAGRSSRRLHALRGGRQTAPSSLPMQSMQKALRTERVSSFQAKAAARIPRHRPRVLLLWSLRQMQPLRISAFRYAALSHRKICPLEPHLQPDRCKSASLLNLAPSKVASQPSEQAGAPAPEKDSPL